MSYYSAHLSDDIDHYLRDYDHQIETSPVCCECGQHITDSDFFYNIHDEIWCEQCIENCKMAMEDWYCYGES